MRPWMGRHSMGELMPRRLDARAKSFASDFDALSENKRDAEDDVSRDVKAIIAEVRAGGDAALIALSRQFDRVELSAETLRVSADDIAAAWRDAAQDLKDALSLAASRIEAYHRRQMPKDDSFTDDTGGTLGWRWGRLSSVGLSR